MSNTRTGATAGNPAWWVKRRLERVLRPVHQCRPERHRADRSLPRRRQAAGRHRVRAHPAGARDRAAARQSVLRLPGLEARQARRTQRRHRPALRAQRAAHVHRRLRRHAADLPQDGKRPARLGGRAGVGVRHWADRAGRRLRRPDRAQIYATCGHAWRAGGHFDRVHLAAAGVPELAGAVALVHLPRHHPGELDGAGAAAVGHAGRLGGGRRRHGGGLARHSRRHQSR